MRGRRHPTKWCRGRGRTLIAARPCSSDQLVDVPRLRQPKRDRELTVRHARVDRPFGEPVLQLVSQDASRRASSATSQSPPSRPGKPPAIPSAAIAVPFMVRPQLVRTPSSSATAAPHTTRKRMRSRAAFGSPQSAGSAELSCAPRPPAAVREAASDQPSRRRCETSPCRMGAVRLAPVSSVTTTWLLTSVRNLRIGARNQGRNARARRSQRLKRESSALAEIRQDVWLDQQDSANRASGDEHGRRQFRKQTPRHLRSARSPPSSSAAMVCPLEPVRRGDANPIIGSVIEPAASRTRDRLTTRFDTAHQHEERTAAVRRAEIARPHAATGPRSRNPPAAAPRIGGHGSDPRRRTEDPSRDVSQRIGVFQPRHRVRRRGIGQQREVGEDINRAHRPPPVLCSKNARNASSSEA